MQRKTAAAAHFSRGEQFRTAGRWEEAIECYGRAAAAAPDFVEAHCNRGNALLQLQRWEAALACFDAALRIDPELAMLHANRAVVLKELGRFEESLESFDRAIARRPGYATAIFNRATLLLSMGDYVRGFADYEWRWEDTLGSVYKEKRAFSQPRWQGVEPIDGRTILLYGEQGLGDALQFCRYVPLVAQLGARVILEVHAPLLTLLADLPGVSQVLSRGSPLPGFDFQAPLMSMAHAFKSTPDSIPQAHRYLTSDPGKQAEWERKLGPARPRIGLAWSGNPAHAGDARRSIALERLLEALPVGFRYVSLQKVVRDPDLAALRSRPDLAHFGDELHDFSDTAALCECMDVVVSVDTSVAHLAAALGKPTWILLSSVPDWRWLLGRDDSPWYRSVTLQRRRPGQSWDPVLQRLAGDLREAYPAAGIDRRV